MATYSVPNIFVAGTKASAEEVNANFSYITTILDGMSAVKYPFCINVGNRDSKGEEDLFSYNSATVTSKVGGSYTNVTYTNGQGLPMSVTTSKSITANPTAYSSIIPAMTSAVQGDVSCDATSEASGNESWHALDKDEETFWGSFVGVTDASLTIALDKRYIVKAYYIKTLTPSEWTLEGSNDQNTWTVLDNYSVADASTLIRQIEVPGNYSVYKLSVKATNDNFQVKIAELDLYRKDEVGLLRIPEKQIIYMNSNEISVRANKFFRQASQPAGKALYDAMIPAMSSNIVPDGYKISSSSYSVSNPAYMATDRREDTYWEATDTLNDVWFQVQLPNSIDAKVCKITLRPDAAALNQSLINGKLLASNNGSTWTTLYEIKNLAWNYANESKYLYFTENTTKYSYYRLVGEQPFGSLAEFQLFMAADGGEFLLGEADVGDIWFKTTEPYDAKEYTSALNWASNFESVPAGELRLNSTGVIESLVTYPYNQNGFNINAATPKEASGNIVTYDSYTSHFASGGYVILPNNMMLQWGTAEADELTIFPAAFPHAVFSVTTTPISKNDSVINTISNLSNSGFTLKSKLVAGSTSEELSYWIAIGW